MVSQSDGHRWRAPLVVSPDHGAARSAKRRVAEGRVALVVGILLAILLK